MTKKQAEKYIYKTGKKYVHLTRTAYYALLLLSVAFFGVSLGICRNLSMVIAVCCFAAFGILFTVVAVKKYMSLFRASVVMLVLWVLLVVAIACMYYSVRYYKQTFTAWECGVYSAVAAFAFLLGFIVRYLFAERAMIKKIIIIAMGGALTAATGITGVVLAVLEFVNVSLTLATISFNAVMCLLLIYAAKFAVRVCVMLRFKVEYVNENPTLGGIRKEIEAKKGILFTTVHGFTYGEYKFYIYAKRDYYRIDMYQGHTRISRNKYEPLKSLFDTETIDGKRLSKLWHLIVQS